MKLDRWTKGILTVIAIFLAIIALRPIITNTPVQAQSSGFGGVQFSGTTTRPGFYVFDTRSGDVWFYEHPQMGGRAEYWGRISKLGKPLTK